MRTLITASGLFTLLALFAAPSAWAQMDAPAPTPEPEKPAEEEEPSDPSLFEGENPGEEENPGDPTIDLVGKPEIKKVAPKVRPPGYPQEVLYRPLTLPAGMAQVSFDYGFRIAPQGDGILAAHYGVTKELQLGLRYGVGSLYDDGYEPGKTFAIDAEYQIQSWVSAQLSIPMLADPYTVAVTLGAPIKFSFRDKLLFTLGRDLVTFRTNRDYYPRIGNALGTAAQVTLDETNTVLSQGNIHLGGSVIYQHDMKMAAELRVGLTMEDFELTSEAPYLFELGGTYAHSQKLDFGGFIGFLDLGNAGDSFGFSVFTRFRIGG